MESSQVLVRPKKQSSQALNFYIFFGPRSLLGQVDAKRPLKEELLKQLHEEGDQTPGELKLFCDDLLSSWHATQQELMARKTELTAMLEHSDNVTTKGREVAQWLSKLESVYADAAVGKTRDVLLRQIREVNQVNRELQQYGHHVTLLSQVILFLQSVTGTNTKVGYRYRQTPVPVVRIRSVLIWLSWIRIN
jgi:hypothetical protein